MLVFRSPSVNFSESLISQAQPAPEAYKDRNTRLPENSWQGAELVIYYAVEAIKLL